MRGWGRTLGEVDTARAGAGGSSLAGWIWRCWVLVLGWMTLLGGVQGREVFGAEAELRGLWVDTFHAAMRNEAEVVRLVADARAAGFNALFVQVRKRGDAYYDSRFEPRASDVAPGFDPLARLLELAHDGAGGPRLEVHAWVVTFNVWNSQSTPPPQSDHPYRRHPEWLTRSVTGARWDGSNYAFDPGHPGVQEHTFQVAMDLIRRYDIDGLHWDYVRYAGNEWGYNEVAVARFNRRFGRTGRPTTVNPDWMQFRRDQVTSLVRKVYLHALVEKPSVRLSAATITFAPGITTTAQWTGSSAYTAVLQDWRAWMEEGILDWNVPMTYFRQNEHPDAFTGWNVFIKDHQYRRRAAIGLGWFLNSPSNSLVQIRATRRATAGGRTAGGVVGYSYAATGGDVARSEFFAALRSPSRFEANPVPVFAEPAEVPAATWKTAVDRGHAMGFVRDAGTEQGIDGAEAVFCGPIQRTLIADATGFFGAVDLVPGSYAVRVSAPGYEPAVADVSVAGARVSGLEFPLSAVDPRAPAGLRASAGAETAVISWTGAWVGAGGAEVVWNESPCGPEQDWRVAASPVGRQSVVLGGLRPATDHRGRVIAGGVSSELVAFRTAASGTAAGDRPHPERVPGWWARHFTGSPGLAAGGDEDADGLTNAAEYLLGTDPTDPASALVVWCAEVPGGRWQVGFRPRVTGRRYELHVRGAERPGAWVAVGADAVGDGAGGGVFRVDAAMLPPQAGWIRVAALWP